MRVVLAFLAVVVLALSAVPYWVGLQAEERYQALLTELDVSTYGMELSHDYERGWLSSTARVKFHPQGMAPALGLTLEDTIHHGPVPIGLLLEDGLPSEIVLAVVKSEVSPPLFDQVLVEARTVIRRDGSGTSELSGPDLSEPMLGLVWRGMTGRVEFEPGMRKLLGAIEAPEFALRADQPMSVRGMRGEFEAEIPSHGMPVGDSNFSVESIEAGSAWALKGVRVTSATAPRGANGTLTSRATLDVESYSYGGEHYGRGKLEMISRNIDPEAMQRFQQVAAKLNGPGAAQEIDPAQMGPLLEVLQALVKPSPSLEISRLHVQTPSGPLEAQAKLKIDGSQGITLMVDPTGVVVANVDLRVPAVLVHSAIEAYLESAAEREGGGVSPGSIQMARARVVAELVESAVIVRHDNDYLLWLDYRNGRLVLNGRPTDPQELANLPLHAALTAM